MSIPARSFGRKARGPQIMRSARDSQLKDGDSEAHLDHQTMLSLSRDWTSLKLPRAVCHHQVPLQNFNTLRSTNEGGRTVVVVESVKPFIHCRRGIMKYHLYRRSYRDTRGGRTEAVRVFRADHEI